MQPAFVRLLFLNCFSAARQSTGKRRNVITRKGQKIIKKGRSIVTEAIVQRERRTEEKINIITEILKIMRAGKNSEKRNPGTEKLKDAA